MKITDTLLYKIIISSSDKTKNYCCPLLGKDYSILEFKSIYTFSVTTLTLNSVS